MLDAVPGSSTGFSIRFTSVSPEIETFLRHLIADEAPPSLTCYRPDSDPGLPL